MKTHIPIPLTVGAAIVALWAVLHAAVDGTNCNPPAAEETNLPPVKKLESIPVGTKTAEAIRRDAPMSTNALPPKVPVYILPRVIFVQTPQGTVIWTEEHHIRELARLFPSGVQTNLVIYNR